MGGGGERGNKLYDVEVPSIPEFTVAGFLWSAFILDMSSPQSSGSRQREMGRGGGHYFAPPDVVMSADISVSTGSTICYPASRVGPPRILLPKQPTTG